MNECGLTLLPELTRVNAILKHLADKSTKKNKHQELLGAFCCAFCVVVRKASCLAKMPLGKVLLRCFWHTPLGFGNFSHTCAHFCTKMKKNPIRADEAFLLLVCALGLCGFFFARCTDRHCLTQKFARGLVDCAITFCSRNGYLLARQRENIFSNSNAISAGLSRSSLFSQWRTMARAPAWQYLNT